MPQLPKRFEKLNQDYPEVAKAYESLGKAVHTSGPLNEKTRALIKLAISTGAGLEGAVHSHTRKAVELGISKEEIRQTVLLALPTMGLPSMSWVDDILDKQK